MKSQDLTAFLVSSVIDRMSRYIAVLFIGVLIGYLGHREKRQPITSEDVSLSQSAAPSAENKVSEAPKVKAPTPIKAPPEVKEDAIQGKPNPLPQTSQEEPEQLSLILNAHEIARIEDHLPDLRQNTRAIFSEKGWTMKIDDSHSDLLRLGLRDGDLIRSDLLEMAKASPETSELASRVENILRSLE